MIEAHYTTDTKVKPANVGVAHAPLELPRHKPFSNDAAEQKMQAINTDIYVAARKEKKEHEFNKKLYFKIFGGVTLLTAGIAGVYKIRNFFRKS